MTTEIARALDELSPSELERVLETPWSKDIIRAIAMDIGKDTVAYVETIYPEAIKATSSTFKLSLRNHIYNQIMAAIEVNDAGKIAMRLKDRAAHRRELTAAYRKIRAKRT